MKKTVALLLCLILCLGTLTFADDSWVCPNCGEKNTAAFCGRCGTKKPEEKWICPNCHKENTNNFCIYCGTKKPVETKGPGEQVPGAKVGEYVKFGTYPQTKKGKDETPIEWLVLARVGGRALLISRYGLDCKNYHAKDSSATWESCTLRTWLNEEFIRNAFTPAERAAILLTDVDNGRSQGYYGYSSVGGKNTRDKIFLLSYAEAWQYFRSDASRVCVPTDYAIAKGAWFSTKDKINGRGAGAWWLRSPGYNLRYAGNVYSNGALYDYQINSAYSIVRPAMWVKVG